MGVHFSPPRAPCTIRSVLEDTETFTVESDGVTQLGLALFDPFLRILKRRTFRRRQPCRRPCTIRSVLEDTETCEEFSPILVLLACTIRSVLEDTETGSADRRLAHCWFLASFDPFLRILKRHRLRETGRKERLASFDPFLRILKHQQLLWLLRV